MKILIVFTGGTIACSEFDGTLAPDRENSKLLLKLYSQIDCETVFTAVSPYSILSENLSSDNLSALYECLLDNNYADFDGVIVTHGTDTLQYTGAYLSYVLGFCRTPVVLVSANYPLADPRSNGLANFIAAVNFIKSGCLSGVFIAYKNDNEPAKLHRASRTLAHLAYSDKILSIGGCYGELNGNTFIKNSSYTETKNNIALNGNYKLTSPSNVLYIKPYVGINYPKSLENTKAVLLEGFHSGTLSTADSGLTELCRLAEAMSIPVFLTGNESGFSYESKLLFDELKITVLPKASPVAMYMKLWLLNGDYEQIAYPCGGDF